MNRRTLITIGALLAALAAALLAFGLPAKLRGNAPGPIADELLLLVADGTSPADPHVSAWEDAASEEGFHLTMMTASEFLRPHWFTRSHAAGIILPDGIHRTASDPFIDALTAEVARGTHLMVVFDAATLDVSGAYAAGKSRLSHVVGADYALYDQLKNETMRPTTVTGSAELMDELRLPPGRYSNATVKRERKTSASEAMSTPGEQQTITSYQYEISSYPHFVTAKSYQAFPLLLGDSGGLVAGRYHFGKGKVLFVNLPLTYLKLRSDGMFLHAFLHYFAADMLDLPYLAPSPQGVGGIVMNWHIDSNAALPALEKLGRTGVFEQGPYSVHFTTGPDTYKLGDGSGLNVAHNADAQRWVRFFSDRGDAVGSHGGWIHNYFGLNVNESNQKDFEKYLALNKEDLEAVTHKPVIEYSAPVGNHPRWTTAWLAGHGFNSYYFTGNIGMGATRSYRNGTRSDQTTWSFPLVTYGKAASFEEAHAAGISEPEIAAWLTALDDFCADNHVIRLVYFHPEGLLYYEDAVREWLKHAGALRQRGRMRWYTMSEVADFKTRRGEVEWRFDGNFGGDGRTPGALHAFSASHPVDLNRTAWVFPKKRFERPVVTAGSAAVNEWNDDWLLVAGEGKRLAGTVREKDSANDTQGKT